MKIINVTVITNVESGWGCVMEVIEGHIEEGSIEDYEGDNYIYHYQTLYLGE